MNIRIGIDMMGGDYAPQSPAEGIAQALGTLPEGASLRLYGLKEIVVSALKAQGLDPQAFEIVHTTQTIEMGESPTKAMSQKTDSSILVGLNDLKNEQIDAFISAGSTGAVYVGAMYTVRPMEGILRPAISSIVPKGEGGIGLILDVGANADCKADVLVQFGLLGSIYARSVYGIQNPKVGLLNIGTEAEKGNLVTQAAYPLFTQAKGINFIGNVEGYDLFDSRVDVIVCDGFTGNIVLKSAEAIVELFKKQGFTSLDLDRYDYQSYGGTPILGVNKPVIIGHGVSSPKAFGNMIRQSIQIITSGMTESIRQAIMPEILVDEKN